MANEVRLIDANAAMLNTYHDVYWTESEAAAVRSFLVYQPTIDPEGLIQKGCWGEYEVFQLTPSLNGYPCSVCGQHEKRKTYFCPNCGAKMEG